MKISKKILGTASAVALLTMANVTAQEDDSFGDFTEDYTEPALTFNGEAGVDGRVWINTKQGYSSSRDDSVKIGDSETQANAYLKLDLNYSGANSDLNGKLKLDAATIKDNPEDVLEEISARGYFGNWQVEAGKIKNVWGKGDKVHVLDNFNANNYTDFIFPDYIDRRLAEPMLKVTYASTYSNDNISDIKVEMIATPMMTADRFATKGQLVPYSQTKLTNTVTEAMKHNLTNGLKNVSGNEAQVVNSIMSSSNFTSDNLLEDNIKTLKYGQFGTRFTSTFNGIDIGASYYYGHYKQPSANLGKYIDSLTNGIKNATSRYVENQMTKYQSTGSCELTTRYGAEIAATATAIGTQYQQAVMAAAANGKPFTTYDNLTKTNVTLTDATTIQNVAQHNAIAKIANDNAQKWYEDGTIVVTDNFALPSLNYDQLQVFGLEAAFVLWKFNTRWELAYNLTEDTAGDNPWVKNNSIAWIGGFDMDLPIHNLNINIQEQGTYILKNDKIKDGAYSKYDVDYNSDGKYTNNQLIVNISDKFLNEKLTPECTTIYVFETKEWCVQPKISYNVFDGLTFTLSGAYVYSKNENGQFYNFTAKDNENHSLAFVKLGAKYQF